MSFASFENIREPRVKTMQTNNVLPIDRPASRMFADLMDWMPMKFRSERLFS
jgi:hypothetical protein